MLIFGNYGRYKMHIHMGTLNGSFIHLYDPSYTTQHVTYKIEQAEGYLAAKTSFSTPYTKKL